MQRKLSRAGSRMKYSFKRNDTLGKSFQESLNGLGDSSMNAIICQLQQAGISVFSDRLDIKEVEERLRDYFGDGAEALMQDMLRHIAIRAMLGLDRNETVEKIPPVEKIQRFLEQNRI